MIGPDDFEKFVKIARANGISTLKLEGLEFAFHVEPQPIIQQAPAIPNEGMPTEDQFLLWSTNHMPDRKDLKEDN